MQKHESLTWTSAFIKQTDKTRVLIIKDWKPVYTHTGKRPDSIIRKYITYEMPHKMLLFSSINKVLFKILITCYAYESTGVRQEVLLLLVFFVTIEAR